MDKTPDKEIEQKIKDEARELYPETFESNRVRYDNPISVPLQQAYIAGRSKGLEREKELDKKIEKAGFEISNAIDEIDQYDPENGDPGAVIQYVEQKLHKLKQLLKP